MNNRYAATIDLSNTGNTHTMLVLMVGEGRRVLELGASSGYMTRVLKDRGCRVTAIEYDEEAGAQLSGVADRTVIGDLNDLALLADIDEEFDVVLAGDVFEHLVRPADVLRAAVQRLAPGGSVVLSVPNVAHADLRLGLLQGRFDYRPTGILDETHLRWFTHRTLVDMLASAGLVVVDLRRATAKVFETELAVPRETVSPETLSEVLRVPESDTYQFVLTAIRDDGTPETAARVAANAPRPEPDFAVRAARSSDSDSPALLAAIEFAQLESVTHQRELQEAAARAALLARSHEEQP